MHHFDVIVGKTDETASQRQPRAGQQAYRVVGHAQQVKGSGEPRRYQRQKKGGQKRGDKQDAAHGGRALLFLMPVGAFFPDGLPEMQLP